jgi:hypothetical protein
MVERDKKVFATIRAFVLVMVALTLLQNAAQATDAGQTDPANNISVPEGTVFLHKIGKAKVLTCVEGNVYAIDGEKITDVASIERLARKKIKNLAVREKQIYFLQNSKSRTGLQVVPENTASSFCDEKCIKPYVVYDTAVGKLESYRLKKGKYLFLLSDTGEGAGFVINKVCVQIKPTIAETEGNVMADIIIVPLVPTLLLMKVVPPWCWMMPPTD